MIARCKSPAQAGIVWALTTTLAAGICLVTPQRGAAQRPAYEELQTFSGVLNHIRLNYVDSVSYSQLVRAAIDGVLRSLDPHSNFVSREGQEKLSSLSIGKLGTVGLALEEVGAVVTVMSVMPDGPAARAGLMPGDRVVQVDETLTAGLRALDVDLLLAGEDGTAVSLSLARGPLLEPDTFSVKLKRTSRPWPSVGDVRMVDSLTGYVHLQEFRSNAGEELHDVLKDLKRRKAQRLILDLRGNPGGEIGAALEVASEFLPKKTLVFRTRGRKAEVNQDYLTDGNGDFRDLPLIVLIDEGSASAAEAVAGSLQDHDRALIVGRRSFGKALVQSAFLLPSGDIVWLTIGHVVSPSGRLIQRPYRGLGVEAYRALAGRVEPESDEVFRTDHGREVRGGGGIRPDIVLPARPQLPAWWREAVESGLTVAVADSVAYTLGDADSARASWMLAADEWRAQLLEPFLQRVRSDLGISPAPTAGLERHLAILLAARVAEVRWGSDARFELEARNDPDLHAALGYFSQIDELLGRSAASIGR